MGKIFEDTMRGLLEAVEMEKGNVTLTEKKGMPAPTLHIADNEGELIKNTLLESSAYGFFININMDWR